MPILLAVVYFSILFFFGWQLARYSLKEKRIEHLVGLAGIFGIGLYVFFINAVGLFLPIKIVFYLVLLLFFLLGLVLFYLNRSKPLEWGIDRRWRKILLAFTLFLVVATGIISFRHPMDLSILREPTAATIAEGNFPPVEIWQPERSLNYHYAPDLFSAAIHKVTRLPLYSAYDLQKAILTGVLFLLGFILVKRFSNSDFKSFVSSLLMLYAGTLVFLRGLAGIPVLYSKYILGQDIFAPFKFVSDAIEGEYGSPVVRLAAELHWGAMAFPLIIAVIYLYFHLLNGERRRAAFFVCGFLLALLALVSEPYFLVLCCVIFVYPFAFALFKKERERAKKFLAVSLLILLIALPTAFFQGGLLKAFFVQQFDLPGINSEFDVLYTKGPGNDKPPFEISSPWTLYDSKPIYSSDFLMDWGLLFAVLVPSFAFLFSRHFELALFLGGVIILSFSIPLIATSSFANMAGQLGRFFYPVNLLGGLAVGLFLSSLYLRVQKKGFKRAILFLTLILMAQALWAQFIWAVFSFPAGTWNPNEKLFAQANSLEGRAYNWVKENTSIRDYFLIIKKNYTECGESAAPNCLFILNTGRMAPIYDHQAVGDKDEIPLSPKAAVFSEVRDRCASSAVRKLNFGYVYVDEKWPAGMEERCREGNTLELKFESSEGDKFVRIYKIIKDN